MPDLNQWMSNTSRTSKAAVMAGVFAFVSGLYAYQFWIQGGRDYLTIDGQWYFALARGERVLWPMSTRLVVPFIAEQISLALGISLHSVFLIITPLCLFTSLLLLAFLLQQRGASFAYQTAVVLAWGSALAVLFGHAPVLVDTPLLLLACLTIAALDRKKFALALVIICVASLTKEYGVMLSLPWAVEARKRFGWRVASAALIPAVILVVVTLLQPALPRATTGELFGYHRSLITQTGLFVYFKSVYIWMWAAMWPVLGFLTFYLLSAAAAKNTFTPDQLRFAALLVGLPLLLLGDMDRAAIYLVPFAAVAGTALEQFQQTRFCALLAAGGVATALARPLYTEVSTPRALIAAMIGISILCSALLIKSSPTLWKRNALVVKSA